MSDAEVMAEVGGKKRLVIIAVAVAVAALLGIFFWKQFKAKDVSKNAAALTPTEIPTQACRRPKWRSRRLLPRRLSPRSQPPAAARAKDADEPTPKAARTPSAAKKQPRDQGAKAKGKKHHKSRDARVGSYVGVLESRQLGEAHPSRRGEVRSRFCRGDRVAGPLGVNRGGLRIAGDELAIGGGDAFLNGVGVVAFLAAAGGAAARRRHRHRQVQQQGQVRAGAPRAPARRPIRAPPPRAWYASDDSR